MFINNTIRTNPTFFGRAIRFGVAVVWVMLYLGSSSAQETRSALSRGALGDTPPTVRSATVLALGQQNDRPVQEPSRTSPTARRTPSQSQGLTLTAARRTSGYGFGSFLATSRGRSLGRTPEMFGDSFFRSGTMTAFESLTGGGGMTLVSDVPLAGGARRTLVAENNKALPTNRVYFNYNHFHNALTSSVTGLTAAGVPPGAFVSQRDASVNQYTLGLESAFAEGLWSVEVRMPLVTRYDFFFDTGAPAPTETASVVGGEIGNLSVILKRALFYSRDFVMSAGVGFDIPTGDEATVTTAYSQYTIQNEAFGVLPFIALMNNSSDAGFWHAFAQLDVPTGGNSILFSSLPPAPPAAGQVGVLTDPVLLHLDIGGGYWVQGKDSRNRRTRLALIAELHYTESLQGVDVNALARPSLFPGGASVTATTQNASVLNTTTGVHLQFRQDTMLRVAAAFPLLNGNSRAFDAEVLVQFGRRF